MKLFDSTQQETKKPDDPSKAATKNQNFDATQQRMPMDVVPWYLTFQECNPGRVLQIHLCIQDLLHIAHLEEKEKEKKKRPMVSTWKRTHRLNPCWKKLNQGIWGGPASICTIKTPRELWFFEPSQHGHLGLVEGGAKNHDMFLWSARLDIGCCLLHTKLVAWWSACYGSSWAWCLWRE